RRWGGATPRWGPRRRPDNSARPTPPPAPRPPPPHPPVGAACEHCHGRPEATSHQADALRIDFRPGGEIGQSVARIGYLVEADDSPMLAFALAAPSKIEAHRHIAPLGKLPVHNALSVAFLVATEAVQHDKRRSALTGTQAVRSVHDPR